MSETALWLVYFLAGGIAFALVHFRRWPISLSMIVGAAVSVAIWLLSILLTSQDDAPAWFEVELALNASLALVLAGLGAGLAHVFPLFRKRRP